MIQAIHFRHFHVQREHVRVGLLDEIARHQGIGRHADHLHVRLAIDDLLHHAANQRRIIHNQNLDFHKTDSPGIAITGN
jgi:hypothetical protein